MLTELAGLSAVIARKELILERFKMEHAVLRNAERALPHSIERLRDAMGADATAEVTGLLNDLLLHTAAPSKARAPIARCALGRLGALEGDVLCAPSAEVAALRATPGLGDLLTGIGRHGVSVVERHPLVTDLVQQLMTLPVVERAHAVSEAYAAVHEAAVERAAARARLLEALVGVTVLLGAALIVTRLQSDAAALRSTTAQLQEAMAALRQERDREAELARLKNLFVATTSHEFRTPLAVIRSSAELMMAYGERMRADRRLKHLNRIGDTALAMSRMVDRVLVIGKADADLLEASPSPVVVSEVVETALAEARAAAPERALEVELRAPETPVLLDAELLRHILTNLLTNALKYSPEDSAVSLAVEADERSARFVVTDAGIGIPEDDIAQLFEPFHRCANASGIPGTGLGLAVVKRAVDAHGGSLRVDSVLGQGSRFTVQIPLSLAEECA